MTITIDENSNYQKNKNVINHFYASLCSKLVFYFIFTYIITIILAIFGLLFLKLKKLYLNYLKFDSKKQLIAFPIVLFKISIIPLTIIVLFIIAYWALAPKIVIVNQSGKDLKISGIYIQDTHTFEMAYGDIRGNFPTVNDFTGKMYQKPLKNKILKSKEKTTYYLSWSTNTGSFMWLQWSSKDQKMNHKMELSFNDFVNLKETTVYIDQNGNYQKEKIVIHSE